MAQAPQITQLCALAVGSSRTDAGFYGIDWAFSGNNNYNSAGGTEAFSIFPAFATITINDYTGVYNGAPQGLTGTAIGVNGEDLSALLDLGPREIDAAR